ncbi:MAG: hypothetical protein WD535_05020 [Thermaerobacterales bacterium]
MADSPTAAAAQAAENIGKDREFRSLNKGEQQRVLVGLIQQGRNDEEIGDIFGLSQWQIRNLRYRLGIKKDRGGNVHIEQVDGRPAVGLPGDLLQAFPAAEAAHGALFAMTMAGVMSAEQLARRLEGMRALCDSTDRDKHFEVRIQLTEAPQPA